MLKKEQTNFVYFVISQSNHNNTKFHINFVHKIAKIDTTKCLKFMKTIFSKHNKSLRMT